MYILTDFYALTGYITHHGNVAAGELAENFEQPRSRSVSWLLGGKEAIDIRGDSMIDSGMEDGDTIIVDRNGSPSPGEATVVRIGDEITVKHYVPRGRLVDLIPANKLLCKRTLPIESVEILGVVVRIIKQDVANILSTNGQVVGKKKFRSAAIEFAESFNDRNTKLRAVLPD